MILKSSCLTALLVGLGLSVAGCADGYGYGGVDAGYGAGYGSGYGYAGGPYGPGYAPGYYGWYDNFYYPGTGAYVFDRDRRAYRWNGRQQRYWQDRRRAWYGQGRRQGWGNNGGWGQGRRPRADWGGFGRPGGPHPDGVRGPRPSGTVRPGGDYRPPAVYAPRPEGVRGPRGGGGRPGRGRR